MVNISSHTKNDEKEALASPERTGPDVFDGITGSWPSGAALALWVFVGLFAYLFIGNIASTFLLALNDVGLQEILSGQQDVFAENGNAFLGGNAIGLALGLGSVALLASWLDSSRPLHYLRLKACNTSDVVLSLAGLICLLPAVLGLGILNEKIPLPDALLRLEEQQMELIEWFTGQGGNFALNMMFVVATPAIFEEVCTEAGRAEAGRSRGNYPYGCHFRRVSSASYSGTSINLIGVLFSICYLAHR